MKKQQIGLNLLYFSIPLSLLVLVTAVGGIFIDATYIRETTSYAAQGIGQDMVNFLIVVLKMVGRFIITVISGRL